MKNIQLFTVITSLTAATGGLAQVPAIINYQGRLSAGGTNLFNGPGQFKFALVNAGTNLNWQANAFATVSGGFLTIITVTDGGHGYAETPTVAITDPTGSNAVAVAHLTAGVVTSITVPNPGRNYSPSPTVTIAPPPPNYAFVTFWSNDGSSSGGSEPAQAVPLVVNQGLFSGNLGDTGLSNMTAAIPPSIFTNSDVRLRIWFSDGVGFSQQFFPDQRLTAAGYAMMAANVADGAITGPKLAPGAVTVNAVAVNAIGTPNIADGSITSAKLAPGAAGSNAIPDGTITTSKLADAAVTAAKLNPTIPAFPNGMVAFTSSGTWTRPVGVNRVHVKLWGGGGGGGANNSGTGGLGKGGGGGGYCEGVLTVVGDVSVAVGSGGAGGDVTGSQPGGSGGTSSFLSLTASGGSGGSLNSSGNGGTASGGSLNVAGQNGQNVLGGNAGFGGGLGGNPSGVSGVGLNGEFPGGGGYGAPSGGYGNAGAPGVVIVYY